MNFVEILIVDDHEMFRGKVRSLIESQPRYRVCGEAGDGIEAIEKARQLRPDIVLMDINMPRMNGLVATRIIRREVPLCRVIIVSQNDEAVAREQARRAGAKAAVTKSDLIRDLLPTIDGVAMENNNSLDQTKIATAHGGEPWCLGDRQKLPTCARLK